MLDKTRTEDDRLGLTDPVCGMQVGLDSEHRHTHEGTEYRFCSAACHDKFVAAPQQYLPAESADSEAETSPSGYCPDDTCDNRVAGVHLPHAPGDPTERARKLSEVRHGTGTGSRTISDDTHGIYLPDASRDRAG